MDTHEVLSLCCQSALLNAKKIDCIDLRIKYFNETNVSL